jgi:hypothetical protein
LKFTVPTKCWLLEQVTSAQTERAAEHIPMLWIRVTSAQTDYPEYAAIYKKKFNNI